VASVRSGPYAAPAPLNLRCLNRADRFGNGLLLLAAAGAWAAVAYVLTTVDPRTDPNAIVAGALLLGTAVSLTLAPLLWLAAFVRNRSIAYRGDWAQATRRAGLVGFVVVLFVVVRAQGALSLPLGAFIVVMAILVELTLSLRR
jgi:hypothetical protein